MDGVISSLLIALLLPVALSSSDQQQSFLPGYSTELIQSSAPKITGKTSFSPELFQHHITGKKSSKSKKKEPNKFYELNKKMKKWLKKEEEKFDVENIIIISDTPTPIIDQKFHTNGSFPDDGCDSSCVRFDDGNCYPLMGRKPCGDPRQWVTIDPYTHKGRCTPRLCGRDRVFVVRTGLCHDIYDTSECQGGRRLYYSAHGDPVCDCPVGQYPFPNPKDDCVPLFTQGPCPYGQVVAISPDGYLGCKLSKCPSNYDGYKHSSKQKQMVPTSDGKCYELGSDGPCSNYGDTSSLLGLDILSNELECVNVTDPSSPYFFSEEENYLIDSVFDQFSPEYDFFRIYLVYQSLRRQGATAISVPSNPSCRAGSGQGKCNSQQQNRERSQAVKPARQTNCSGGRTFNARTGECSSRAG